MATTYTVLAPLVQVRLDNGGFAHVYEGGELPDNADPEHVELLLADDMVAKGTGADPAEAGDDDGHPARNASLEEWQDYARGQGATDADLEGVSRNELRDRYV